MQNIYRRPVFAIVLILVFVAALMTFRYNSDDFVDFTAPALRYPSKCFDCEAQFSNKPEFAWMGQNTKCFSCEKDLVFMTGDPRGAFLTHPVRYY